jgi:hypothetical protein
MIRTLSSSGSLLTEFTRQLFFDQTLINALDHFGFAVQLTRLAGHHQRTASIPARRSRRLPTPPLAAVMLRP